MDLAIEGAGELVNRLQRFDREVYTILQREVREASRLVADDARERLPSERVLFGGRSAGEERSKGWGPWLHSTQGSTVGAVTIGATSQDLSYDGPRARLSIKVGAKKYRRMKSYVGIVGRVTLKDPGAVMYALMGKKPTGSRFERVVVARYGSDYPRALGPAWTKYAPRAGQMIDEALDRAKRTIGL